MLLWTLPRPVQPWRSCAPAAELSTFGPNKVTKATKASSISYESSVRFQGRLLTLSNSCQIAARGWWIELMTVCENFVAMPRM
jgi:hypothetical protein